MKPQELEGVKWQWSLIYATGEAGKMKAEEEIGVWCDWDLCGQTPVAHCVPLHPEFTARSSELPERGTSTVSQVTRWPWHIWGHQAGTHTCAE